MPPSVTSATDRPRPEARRSAPRCAPARCPRRTTASACGSPAPEQAAGPPGVLARDEVDGGQRPREPGARDRPGCRSACPRATAFPPSSRVTRWRRSDHGVEGQVRTTRDRRTQGLLRHPVVEEARYPGRLQGRSDQRTRRVRRGAVDDRARCRTRSTSCRALTKGIDVAVLFTTERKVLERRFGALATRARARRAALGRLAEEGLEGRRPISRSRSCSTTDSATAWSTTRPPR